MYGLDVYNQVVARRIALTLAVLPLIVLVGLRSALAVYACSVDGKVRDACCCPKDDDAKRSPTDGAPRIQASDCCEVTLAESPAGPAAREVDRLQSLDASPIVLVSDALTAQIVPAEATRTRITYARPPPRAIPTYLANRTILR